MANFNTYQARQFYVAKAIDDDLDTVGDIYLKTTANGKAFFNYVNADGLLTATDVFDPKNIVSLRKTEAAEMDIPLMAHTITLNTNEVASLTALVGKAVNLTVTINQFMSYDMADSVSVVASIVGDATNTASQNAFNKAIAKALVNAIPTFAGEKPFKVFLNGSEVTKETPDANYQNGALVIVEAAQKWYRNKMAKEAFPLTISSDAEGLAWAADAVAPSAVSNNTVIPSAYQLADLEAFALGERGNIYRYGNEPNYEPPTYMIDVSKEYNVLSIEYYWQGGAENVQKSPRMIQIAAEAADSDDVVTTLYEALVALINEGVSASS